MNDRTGEWGGVNGINKTGMRQETGSVKERYL